jgi:hypothetical protein
LKNTLKIYEAYHYCKEFLFPNFELTKKTKSCTNQSRQKLTAAAKKFSSTLVSMSNNLEKLSSPEIRRVCRTTDTVKKIAAAFLLCLGVTWKWHQIIYLHSYLMPQYLVIFIPNFFPSISYAFLVLKWAKSLQHCHTCRFIHMSVGSIVHLGNMY